MDSTSAPSRARAPRVHWFEDLLLGVILIFLEAIVVAVLWYGWAISAWAESTQPNSGAGSGESQVAVALGIITLFVALVAFGLLWARRTVAGVTQALLALTLAAVTLMSASA